MLTRLCTVFATMFFAVFTAALPAGAATIQWNIENVPSTGFAGLPVSISGFFDFTLTQIPGGYIGDVTNWNISVFDGISSGRFTPFVGTAFFAPPGTVGPYGGIFFNGSVPIYTIPGYTLPVYALQLDPLNLLDGSVPIVALEAGPFGGSNYTLQGEGESWVSTPASLVATPLPTALPLFGSALAGLAGLGWLKRRKVSVNR